MTTFLFWNLNKKPLHTLVANIALLHQVDVVMLVECSVEASLILKTLNRGRTADYHYAPSIGCEKVEIFTRFPYDFILPIFETSRLTIRRLTLPGLSDVLLAIIHFPSKLYWSEASQASECVELSNSIKSVEQQVGHARTILVGDLNMNPFEDGIVNANGLHGVMSRSVAEEMSRTVQSRGYPFFYNPMWSLFGDMTPGPPGTFFYRSSEHRSFFWNMFDQLLIRPDLITRFDNRSLTILQSDGTTPLVKPNGLPDSDVSSDHLPLLFSLSL